MSQPIQIRPTSEIHIQTRMAIVVGKNGTGKTTFLRQICNMVLANGRRVLVITRDDTDWTDIQPTMLRRGVESDFRYSGIRRHIYEENHTLNMLKFFRNGLVVFDDCRTYFRAVTPPELYNIIARRRHYGLDIFAVAHGFTQIPPVFFSFATDFVLYQTTDSISRRKGYIAGYENVSKKVEEVNDIATGRRPHPKDYTGVDEAGKSLAGRKVVDIHYCDTVKNE